MVSLNLNELLAFETERVLKVKDWKLGLLHYSAMIVVFLYIFIWSLLLHGGWFETSSIFGVVRLSYKSPTLFFLTMVAYASDTGIGPALNIGARHPCEIYNDLEACTPADVSRSRCHAVADHAPPARAISLHVTNRCTLW